jgi:hypothetical protein
MHEEKAAAIIRSANILKALIHKFTQLQEKFISAKIMRYK